MKSAPPGIKVVGLSHAQCDIVIREQVESALATHRPAVVINTAAYTRVDDAEKEPELAHAVNAIGAGNLARAADRARARIVHISTDYVFDGVRRQPYTPDVAVNPINEYGRTKAAGEREILTSTPNFLIIRSGWLYASHPRNFVRTILSALQASRPLRVVDDQIGVPTSARGLAKTIWSCVVADVQGLYHWADAGTASWYGFALAIGKIALERGLITATTEIVPVSSEQFSAPAPRPRYSVLDATELWESFGTPPHWEEQLEQTLTEKRSTAT
jgi:dTDP-4-dehydrorhamnose reductase